jgi:hypothetical protein
MKRGCFILAVIVFFLVSFEMVLGFGIVSYYYKDNPLMMSPGEAREIEFGTLQNMLENSQDMKFSVELVSGSEIASLLKTEYEVLRKTQDVPVNIKVSIPKDAPEGKEYFITVKFKEISRSGEGEMVEFTKTTTKSIPVFVRGQEKKEEFTGKIASKKTEINQPAKKFNLVLSGAVLLMIICIVFLFLRKITYLRSIIPKEMLK